MSRTCAMPTPPMRGPATTHDEERSAAAPIGAGTRPPSALAGSLVGQSRRGSGCLGAAEERRLVRRRRRLPLPPPRHTPPQAHHDLTPPHSAWLASARQAPQPTAGPTADRDGTARERHAPSRAEPLQRPPAASSARLPVGRLGQLAGWAGSRLTGFWPTAAQPPPAHGPAQASLIPVSRVAPSISECRLAALVFAPPSPPVPPPLPSPPPSGQRVATHHGGGPRRVRAMRACVCVHRRRGRGGERRPVAVALLLLVPLPRPPRPTPPLAPSPPAPPRLRRPMRVRRRCVGTPTATTRPSPTDARSHPRPQPLAAAAGRAHVAGSGPHGRFGSAQGPGVHLATASRGQSRRPGGCHLCAARGAGPPRGLVMALLLIRQRELLSPLPASGLGG